MRETLPDVVEKGRERHGVMGSPAGQRLGACRLRCPLTGERLSIIFSDGSDWKECGFAGEPWEHVSARCDNRTPTWEEMAWVKSLFWLPEEVVVEYHVESAEHVNVHPHVLHLWKAVGVEFPRPPRECV